MNPVTDEIKAQRLAEWLASPAGTDPPADLEPEVLATVWTLVPDRAPAPRVTLDDIFAAVEEGPFATPAPTTGKVVVFPGTAWNTNEIVPPTEARKEWFGGGGESVSIGDDVLASPEEDPAPANGPAAAPAPSNVVELRPAAPAPRTRGPSRWWMAPAFGLALAAAAATLVVVPMVGKMGGRPDLAAREEAQLEAAPAAGIAEMSPPAKVAEPPAPPPATPPAAPGPMAAATPAPDAPAPVVAAAPKPDASAASAAPGPTPRHELGTPSKAPALVGGAAPRHADDTRRDELPSDGIAEQAQSRTPAEAQRAPGGDAANAGWGASEGGAGKAPAEEPVAATGTSSTSSARSSRPPAANGPAASREYVPSRSRLGSRSSTTAPARDTTAPPRDGKAASAASPAPSPVAEAANAPAAKPTLPATSSAAAPTSAGPSSPAAAAGPPSPGAPADTAPAGGAPLADAQSDAQSADEDQPARGYEPPAAPPPAWIPEALQADPRRGGAPKEKDVAGDDEDRFDAEEADDSAGLARAADKTEAKKQQAPQQGAGAAQSGGATQSGESRRGTSRAGAPASNAATPSVRAQATPFDYDPGWYQSLPDIVPAYEAARAQEAAGNWAAAATAWQALLADGRANVAQDAAIRAAKALRAAGRPQDALKIVDQGLRRSDANTSFRAMLFALRGDLLAAAGSAAAAEAAWEQAAGLNAGR
jgi:hypothetical protein